MKSRARIQIEQLVHGYRDGHELLAASIDLPADDRATLLVHSDLAVPSGRDTTSAYLTAYPLPQSQFYAVAKTWYAYEKPRPGCVWTHTLLLRNEDVARISGLEDILHLFRRPSDDTASDFERSVNTTIGSGEIRHFRRDIAATVLTALYGSSSQPIVLIDKTPDAIEPILFALWRQQWPRLRRSFRFSTGAITAADETFDLSFSTETSGSPKNTRSIYVKPAAETPFTATRWLNAALSDLQSEESPTRFRSFLWQFGPDFQDGRAVFCHLCELADVALAPGRELHTYDLISALAHFFPGESALRLKASVLGQQNEDVVYEARLLEALSLHPSAGETSDEVLHVYERAKALFTRDPQLAFQTVVAIGSQAPTNQSRSDDFLRGVGDALLQAPSRAIGFAPVEVLLPIAKLRHEVIESPAFWAHDPDELDPFLDELLDIPDLQGDRLVSALLEARAFRFLNRALAKLGKGGILATLQWLDRRMDSTVQIAPEILASIRANREKLGRIVGPAHLHRAGALVAAATLSRTSIAPTNAVAVFSRIEDDVSVAPRDLQIEADSYLLALGLANASEQAAKIVARAFSPVYWAARENRLPDRLWTRLEALAPWGLRTPWWDRCARLVRAAAQRFVENDWHAQFLFKTFRSDEEFSRCLDELDSMRLGRSFLKALENDSDGCSKASKNQLRMLRSRLESS